MLYAASWSVLFYKWEEAEGGEDGLAECIYKSFAPMLIVNRVMALF